MAAPTATATPHEPRHYYNTRIYTELCNRTSCSSATSRPSLSPDPHLHHRKDQYSYDKSAHGHTKSNSYHTVDQNFEDYWEDASVSLRGSWDSFTTSSSSTTSCWSPSSSARTLPPHGNLVQTEGRALPEEPWVSSSSSTTTTRNSDAMDQSNGCKRSANDNSYYGKGWSRRDVDHKDGGIYSGRAASSQGGAAAAGAARRSFPPPVASCVTTLSIKEGGRFVLKEMEAWSPGFFRAERANGRLCLRLIQHGGGGGGEMGPDEAGSAGTGEESREAHEGGGGGGGGGGEEASRHGPRARAA